jgi:hypothetical protein
VRTLRVLRRRANASDDDGRAVKAVLGWCSAVDSRPFDLDDGALEQIHGLALAMATRRAIDVADGLDEAVKLLQAADNQS